MKNSCRFREISTACWVPSISDIYPMLLSRLSSGFGKLILIAAISFTCVTAAAGPTKRILFLVGEVEYGTTESLPIFAKEVLQPLGYKTEFIFAASDDRSSPDAHRFQGLSDALDRADLLFISTRRRFPSGEQMAKIKDWVNTGKPVIGIRTASHAFGARPRPDYAPSGAQRAWDTIDRDVFGMRYDGHYKNNAGQTMIRRVREANAHAIMQGMTWEQDQPVTSSLYKNLDLDDRAFVLLSGLLEDQPETYQPVSWVREDDGSRTFYTSLGDPEHFKLPWFQNHLANAIAWTLASPTDVNRSPIDPSKVDYEARQAGLSPESSLAAMQTPSDLEVDLLVAEPGIEQPVFLNFDERGRMWVVEYRQYPEPAGLEAVSRDQFWRIIYDRKPMPPGHPDFTPGLDRITIHEDTDGDGVFDSNKTFADGLNLATSVVTDKDGVWVLNPPYLLFYPDADHDDVPDSDPIVHLDGFGIQDTHSVVNSFCWGPDGWLYGAQGSTVTSDVVVTGSDAEPISRVGQLMWRYHPEQRRYEVFAEGGGNIWSCEIDSEGRLIAGTNDNHVAYFYLQGAFYKKNFGKHGALSNPHAYDYFQGIKSPGHRRISNAVVLYEGATLPQRYHDSLIYLGTLQGRVGAHDLELSGLHLQGTPINAMLEAEDRWFRPVYFETGPDGALYIADWYDRQVNHYLNHEGKISKLDGRIFRLRAKDSRSVGPIDFHTIRTDELVDVLNYRNRWWRETARQQLRGRKDRSSVAPRLNEILRLERGQYALEALWTLNLIGAFDTAAFDAAITHPNPAVRRWAIRLIGDRSEMTAHQFDKIATAIAKEADPEVLSQAVSSAARFPAKDALRLLTILTQHDAAQNHPDFERVLWWAIEPFYATHPDAVLEVLLDLAAARPRSPLPALAEFAIRRMASAGEPDDLLRYAELLSAVNHPAWERPLVTGFEAAFKGRSMAGLPSALIAALSQTTRPPISLLLRLDLEDHLEAALAQLQSPATDLITKTQILDVLSETRIEAARLLLVGLLHDSDAALLPTLLATLQIYEDPQIARTVIDQMPRWHGSVRDAAEGLLTRRSTWSRIWVDSMDATTAPHTSVNALAQLRRFEDPAITAGLEKWFGHAEVSSAASLDAEITRVRSIISTPGGDALSGYRHYQQRCAACHTLFEQGGRVGPDLTTYQRDDLDSLLLSIIHPSAEIRAGYEMTSIETSDGRTLSGFLSRNDDKLVGVRTAGGGETILRHEQITKLEMQKNSLMPESLLAGLSDDALRDLFNYLRSPQPLSIPN
ncbi:MAG: c-type cytochrome [Opitutaceae bacterium]|nr:c-type cytochrome [Opitutaceae bacterium]